LLGLGAVGLGVSFAWPEAHDRVAAQSASTRELYLELVGSGLTLGARM
jgi:hypothetical protein